MNKKKKSGPWNMVAVVITAFILVLAFLAYGVLSDMKKMKPLPTQEIVKGIYSIDCKMVNFYVLKGPGGMIAIDTGKNPAQSLRELNKLGLDANQVAVVFLTHTDVDHDGGLSLFENAKVYISPAEEQLINGKTSRSPVFKNSLKAPYGFLADGQVTNAAGFSVRSILVPGHTTGSLCYLVNGKYLFTGDTLSLKDGKAGTFVRLFNMDTELQKVSIRKLAALTGVEYVLTAHNGLTMNFQKAFESWK